MNWNWMANNEQGTERRWSEREIAADPRAAFDHIRTLINSRNAWRARFDKAEQQAKLLRRELKAAEATGEAALKYAQHLPDCPALPGNQDRFTWNRQPVRTCDCGLDALRRLGEGMNQRTTTTEENQVSRMDEHADASVGNTRRPTEMIRPLVQVTGMMIRCGWFGVRGDEGNDMAEYFIVANSFAAPFVSDTSTGFAAAETPVAALDAYASNYKHPAGLYAAAAYESAEAYHKGAKPIARWLSNHARRCEGATMVMSHAPGSIEVDGVAVRLREPKSGRAEYVGAAKQE